MFLKPTPQLLQQIKDSEECETRPSYNIGTSSKINQSRTIIEEQDFEYKETLRKDIEKEQEKLAKSKSKSKKNENTNNENTNNTNNTNGNGILVEDEKPKTIEEMRNARMAFFQKK